MKPQTTATQLPGDPGEEEAATRLTPGETKGGRFITKEDKKGSYSVIADMMHQQGRFHHQCRSWGETLALDYQGGRFSLIIFLPDKTIGLPKFEDSISVETLQKAVEVAVKYKLGKGTIEIPRFSISSKLDWKQTLGKMGLGALFSRTNSGLDGIAPGLFLSSAVEITKISVNEEGAEAGSLFSSSGLISAEPEPFQFRADRPFLYLIYDKEIRQILFCADWPIPCQMVNCTSPRRKSVVKKGTPRMVKWASIGISREQKYWKMEASLAPKAGCS